MENYSKGDNVEVELEVSVPGCHDNTSKMVVNPNTKMRDILTVALNKFKTEEQQLWIGSGPAAVKAVSCVEVIKRRNRNLQQITQLAYKRVEEYWEPKLEGLDRLRVTREVPTVVILLSKQPLDPSLSGYQAPGSLGDDFCKPDVQQRRRRKEPRGRYGDKNVPRDHKTQNMTQVYKGENGERGMPEEGEALRGGRGTRGRGKGGHRMATDARKRSDSSGGGGGGRGKLGRGSGEITEINS
ncbi:ribonuclease P protein subunit p25-like protein [Homarus americanus]|uniref:Ribonuclease P protein subunit p25-like protein-like n=1 Tax=Homarus americanus TaxID=6706 RepID=A0A8J5JVG5_HOMAM|nr:ribonuclease P protein subunit p25-like protein [Homarus americanus]KAG7159954.1 Ribonuclease P protein subunit p25-like protein-like [Homarus americanus]